MFACRNQNDHRACLTKYLHFFTLKNPEGLLIIALNSIQQSPRKSSLLASVEFNGLFGFPSSDPRTLLLWSSATEVESKVSVLS
mmetsp:Transcript_28928/g.38021  ORF Transcript_28928/g.38021 Transcript_28928/m.38021 type:complete len:84 (+) Transcript_28928:81-332(+)